MEEEVWWCFAGDTVSDLFRIQGTLNNHGYHTILQRGTIICFSTGQWSNTSLGCVDQEGEWWSAASNDLTSTITWPQPKWDSLGWVGPQSEGKAANKCSAYVGTPSRLLEKHSKWSWLRECQECAKLSSRQMVATLENQKSILICLTLFWLLHVSMCYMS